MWLISCVDGDPLLNPPGGRSFWTLKIRNGQYQTQMTTAMYFGEGTYAIAYVADKTSVSEARVSQVLSEFDTNIALREHSLFTTPLDIDGNGKVVLLFLDIDDGYEPGGGYIAGYFDPLNQFSDASVQRITGRRSNEIEMLYLDTYPADVGGHEFMSTLAHEYQHLLQFSQNYRTNSNEATWVDEGLSEIASDLAGYGPRTSRIKGFRNIANGTNGTLGDALTSWDGGVDDYNHAYVYFRYLLDAFGEEVISRVFKERLPSVEGVEAALAGQAAPKACGGFAIDYIAEYPRFICSYRFLWGSILGLDKLQGATGSSVLTNADLPGQLAQGHNPLSSLSVGDFGQIIYSGNVPTEAQLYEPFSFGFFRNNETGENPGLSSCTGCKSENFTLLYNTSSFVVFNHHLSETTFGSATKIIDNSLMPVIEQSEQERVVKESPDYSLFGEGVLPQVEKRHRLHFTQPLDSATRSLLELP